LNINLKKVKCYSKYFVLCAYFSSLQDVPMICKQWSPTAEYGMSNTCNFSNVGRYVIKSSEIWWRLRLNFFKC